MSQLVHAILGHRNRRRDHSPSGWWCIACTPMGCGGDTGHGESLPARRSMPRVADAVRLAATVARLREVLEA